MMLMVWWRVVIVLCVLDFAIWDAFLFVFIDGLRGCQEDDEEVFQRNKSK